MQNTQVTKHQSRQLVGRVEPPARARKKQASTSTKGQKGHGLSPLSEAYARSLINPFTGPVACIPDYPVIPSRKMKVYIKGIFESGTSGFGFIQFRPQAMPGSDVPAVAFSDSTYAGTTTQVTGAGIVTANSNSDYVGAAFGGAGSLANVRIVSAGLRIRYAGTELNRGGIAVGLQQPSHATLNANTFANIDSAPQSKRFRPKQGWISQCYCPALVGELAYYNTVTGNSIVTAAGGYIVFVVQAPAGGTSVSYEFEAHANLEVNGSAVRGLTPSASDPSGIAAVHTVANLSGMRPTDNDPEKEEVGFLKRIEDLGMNTISSWGNSFVDKIESGTAVDWLADLGESVMALF